MKRLVVLLLSALPLAACVSVRDRPPVADTARAWVSHSERLAPLSVWEIHGRVALRSESEGWQASMVWSRQQENHQIDLRGPLGRGHVRLTRTADGATLKDADQRVYRNSSAEELLVLATGYRLPLDGLNFWVRGLPAPSGQVSQELDDQGRLAKLKQLGWDVEFLEYETYAGLDLPAKLFARRRADGGRADRAGEEFEVRMVIERWTLK